MEDAAAESKEGMVSGLREGGREKVIASQQPHPSLTGGGHTCHGLIVGHLALYLGLVPYLPGFSDLSFKMLGFTIEKHSHA